MTSIRALSLMNLRKFSSSSASNQLVKAPLQLFGTEGRYIMALYSAAVKLKQVEAVEKDMDKVSMPLVLRSHLGREAYPNVFHSHSRFSGKAVHKSEMLCVRFYSHSTSKDKEEEVPFYMKYLPKFMVRKRGFATRSYDELNVIDFHDKSNLDFHVPLSEYREAIETIGELRTQLDLYQGFFLAEIVRCTLEKFIEKILKPQNYLKPGTKETAENIEKAFVAFLSDDTNDLAVQLKTLLISLDIVVIANCSRLSYKKTSKIVHRALESYLDDYDVTALYTSLEKAPRLKDQEKLVVNKILELLYNNNLL